VSDCISFGGGVNSVALTVLLVNEGWRGPIVMADTGAEWPETVAYVEQFERDWLRPRGLHIEHLGAKWRESGYKLTLPEYCAQYAYLPFSRIRWCTQRYKTRPIAAWMEAHAVTVQHLGIAADESQRCPDASRPLCERGITRAACIEIIRREGLSVPSRSNCWLCPFQKSWQWRELWEKDPDLYERAASLEDAATERRGVRTMLDPSGRWTLRDLAAHFERQPRLVSEKLWEALKC